MILWTLRGHVDSEGERDTSQVVCSIEKCDGGYRLLIEHGCEIQHDEIHKSTRAARIRAEAIKRELLRTRWTDSAIETSDTISSSPDSSLDADAQPHNRYYNRSHRAERDMSELLGLVKGVLADGVVIEPESKHLGEWILAHPDAWNSWPVEPIAQRLLDVFSDGQIDDEERDDLFELLNSLVGGEAGILFDDQGRGVDAATRLPLDDPPPPIIWSGSVFVLSGKFVYGTRSRCEAEIATRGGFCEDNVSERTRYLVIGTFGSRDWAHTSFGRKIEKAVEYRAAGVALAIVSEEHWASSISTPMLVV